MNKRELIAALARETDASIATASASLEALIRIVGKALKRHDAVRITGFGTFDVRKRSAHKGRNPHTGEAIRVKASKRPVFRAGATLKAAIR